MSPSEIHALVFAGLLLAAAITLFAVGAFFVEAWRRRQNEKEYLLFGLAAVALAWCSAAVGGAYIATALATPEAMARCCDGVFVGAGPAAALLVHFAMRHAGWEKREVTSAVYAVAAVGAGVGSLGYWRGRVTPPASVAGVGIGVPVIHIHFTWLGSAVAGAYFVMVVSVCALLVYADLRSGREGATVAGALLLVASFAHDVAFAGFGLFDSVSLLPFGAIAFAYCVAFTLVSRYGRVAEQLATRRVELGRRSEELVRSLDELRRAQDDLVNSEQLAVVGEFAAVITHEVRNPMTIVNNAVSGLRGSDSVTEDSRSLLAIIEQEMVRLERLVIHLLNYARPMVAQPRDILVEELLKPCLVAMADAYPDVEHALVLGDRTLSVHVDVDLMRQALDNIIANAVQAMDGRGELTVRVARRRVEQTPSVIIGVEDTGVGMSEHQLEQATSPFFTTRPSGTGLGLAICERIVDAHGGLLVVSSERGVGTAVSVIVPETPSVRLASLRRTGSLPPAID